MKRRSFPWLPLLTAVVTAGCGLLNHPVEPEGLYWGYEPRPVQKIIDDFEDADFISFLGTAWTALGDAGGGNPVLASEASIQIVTDTAGAQFPEGNKVLRFDYGVASGAGDPYPWSMAYIPLPEDKRNISIFTGIGFDIRHSGKSLLLTLESPLTIADGYDHFFFQLNAGSMSGSTNWFMEQVRGFRGFVRGGWGTQTNLSIGSVLSNVTAIQLKVTTPGDAGSFRLDNAVFVP